MATMAIMATPILKLEKMKCEWVEGGVINNQRIPRRFFFQRLARGGGHGGHGGHGPKVTLGAVARHPGADVGYLCGFVGFVHDWWPPPSPPRDHHPRRRRPRPLSAAAAAALALYPPLPPP